MGLETGTYISDLVATNPVGATDQKSQGDDHLRLLKSTIKATFPNISGEVTPTHTLLNLLSSTTNDRVLRVTGGGANIGQLTAGMFPNTVVPDAALSANVALYNANMSGFSSGTLADARLSSNVALRDSGAAFSTNQTISAASSPALLVTDTTNTVTTLIQSGDTTGAIGTSTAHDLIILAGGSARMTIAGDGSEIDLTATALDLNGALDVSGSISGGSQILAASSFAFVGDSNTGIQGASDVLSIITGGGTRATFAAAEIDLTATLIDINGALDVSGNCIFGSSGSNVARFNNAVGTGISMSGTSDGTLNINVNGTNVRIPYVNA